MIESPVRACCISILKGITKCSSMVAKFCLQTPTLPPPPTLGMGMYISYQIHVYYNAAQWLSGRVLDSRSRSCGFEPHWRHCIVSLSKNINPSLVHVLAQPRKTRPYINERLMLGGKESNQTNKHVYCTDVSLNKV